MSKIIFDYDVRMPLEIVAEWNTVEYPRFIGPATGGIGEIKAFVEVVESYDPIRKKACYTKIDIFHSLPEHIQEKIESEVYQQGREQDAEKLDRVD